MQVKLLQGYSHATIQSNIAQLLSSGIQRDSAIYTAFCAARVSFFRKFPSGALPAYLTYSRSGRLKNYYAATGAPLRKNPARRNTGHKRINAPQKLDIAKAAKLIEDFSGHKARIAGKLNFPKNPGVAIAIGSVLGVAYETKRDGVTEKYYHRFTLKTSRPLLVASKDGKQLYILGGEYDFTERGIVDRK